MKYLSVLFFLPFTFSSCKDPSTRTHDLQSKTDNISSIERINTSHVKADKKNESIAIPATHLQDTTFIKGNFILFLRPDSARFESYTKDPNSGIYEADSDFGFSISATMDTISSNKKYKNIKTEVSEKRYIVITGCKKCPQKIDRDTINYGLILSKKDQEIKINTFLHSGDYLYDVDEYFNIKKSTKNLFPDSNVNIPKK